MLGGKGGQMGGEGEPAEEETEACVGDLTKANAAVKHSPKGNFKISHPGSPYP